MIAIIDYGAGNIFSVKNALDYLGFENKLTDKKEDIEKADAIILPGVGAFPWAMNMLGLSGLIDTIKEQAKIKPFLGICLERLVIAVLVQRADTGFFQAGYDVAGCYPRTMHACFASLQFVIGQNLHNGFCGSTVDALQSFFERGLCM